uniref:Ion transport domain-containing protein n=1 Tax=Neogobius melanostomus TaxID=47308 RepID=A0A8C6TC73_9GOBI
TSHSLHFNVSQQPPPPTPPPVVINRYSDDQLRAVAKRMRERLEIYKDKATDPYASSPEITPPVSECRTLPLTFHVRKAEVGSYVFVLFLPIKRIIYRRYIAWLSLVTMAFNYNIWFLTARLCFPYHTEGAIMYWFTGDLLADLIYLTDSVLFQARKQFVKGGDVIVNRAMTKKHYRESERFKTDMLSLIPFDLLYYVFGFKSIFRFNRLLKVKSFFEFSDRLESIMAKAYIWRVIRTIGYLLFMLHLNACIYYVASDYQGIGKTKWVYSGQGSAYLSCFFYAEKSLLMIAELPVPDSHTIFEIAFQMTNFFTGVFVFSSLPGQMRDIICAATAGQTYFRSSMDNTVAYMVTNRIPALVQNRVRTWYTYTWDAQGMLDESELLDKMPPVMKTAIIDLFKGCDQQMLVDMLLRLKSIIYLPGDFVVKKVSSVTDGAGDGGNRRTANVKAYGFANLFVLEKKDLFDILVHYPESQKVLARKGRWVSLLNTAKAEEDKKKGLALFGPKPPRPKCCAPLEEQSTQISLKNSR